MYLAVVNSPPLVILLITFLRVMHEADAVGFNDKTDTCGTLDWRPYSLTKCFKLIGPADENDGSPGKFMSYLDAERQCETEDSTLPSIGNPEEEAFLLELINGSHTTDIWLGGKIINGSLTWLDGSPVTFTNWLDNDSLTKGNNRSCIQMNTGEPSVGKWTFGHCTHKFNYAICQKPQRWEASAIQRILMETRLEMMGEISSMRASFELSKKYFLEAQKALHNEIKALKLELEKTKQKDVNQNFSKAVVENAVKRTIPPGFIYIQYGNQAEPKQIWPSLSWTEVTAEYSGQFFRAVGGESESFGAKQSGNVPQVTRVSHEWVWRRQRPNENFQGDVFLRPGQTTEPIRTGRSYGAGVGSVYGITFTMSEGEVRPYNSAVRIWKRV